MNEENLSAPPKFVLRTILRDVHFWIPLCVLIAGLVLLHELR